MTEEPKKAYKQLWEYMGKSYKSWMMPYITVCSGENRCGDDDIKGNEYQFTEENVSLIDHDTRFAIKQSARKILNIQKLSRLEILASKD